MGSRTRATIYRRPRRMGRWLILAAFLGLVLGFALAWSVSYHFPAGTVCYPPRP